MGDDDRRGGGRRERAALAARPWRRFLAVLRGPGWARVALARRVGAGALATVAVVLAVAPDGSADQAPVLVTVRDLAPGSAIRAEDLAVRTWPSALVPAGALRAPPDAQGRVAAGAVRAGEPLTDLRLVGVELTVRAGGPDAAAVPLRPADPAVAALLAPGTVVDVVTLGPGDAAPGADAGDGGSGARVIAGRATVLTVLPAQTQGVGRSGAGPLVLVALPRDAATDVAAASLAGEIAVTLR
ncbi:SAF domain-containing protein [Pseudonocardia sp. KRD291]|uniref:SAF domain-containing protein n=1 Tax=Pseudonocardia sp. KRD291 TaxID=2792007 RepID=UPI001C49F70D|nr:SAF domain-containing protein [Pseudonocardia sp. KRD291]MBW0101452.1 flagellar biosynthesis protein FlgA [Pseudonocardia sp. KRD291]